MRSSCGTGLAARSCPRFAQLEAKALATGGAPQPAWDRFGGAHDSLSSARPRVCAPGVAEDGEHISGDGPGAGRRPPSSRGSLSSRSRLEHRSPAAQGAPEGAASLRRKATPSWGLLLAAKLTAMKANIPNAGFTPPLESDVACSQDSLGGVASGDGWRLRLPALRCCLGGTAGPSGGSCCVDVGMNPPPGPRVSPEPSFVATPLVPGKGDSTPNNLSTLGQLPLGSTTAAVAQAVAWVPFPTVDVPAHAHYTLGTVILLVGLTGMLGNLTVIYTFCRSRGLWTPANMFIINLAVSDFLMSFTQAPVFFTSSLYKRWLFGEAGCEFYAFCGALFGITSMITLTAITLDRYLVITRPLATIGVASKRQAALVLLGIWLYALAWSLPPFFGWSAYVPEGLLTSCSWDYVTFTPSVRAYTMLLFCFVFFLPLLIIIYCYIFIFKAIQETGRAIESCGESPRQRRQWQRLRSEWKMAKIALLVTLLFVLSWAPYSTVALVAFAGYAHVLTPYMNSVPAVIAKASAIHNPIIYAITHPKYRVAIAQHLPCLGVLLGVSGQRGRPSLIYRSTHRSTLSSQASDLSWISGLRRQESLGSESEMGWTDTETWGAAQQASGRSPCDSGLEDGEARVPPRA
ncbi:melanopsin [Erethizon dorsatum]